jgi:uncharacterized protein (DUF58 family)
MPTAPREPARALSVPRPTRTAALLLTFAVVLELLGRLVDSTAIAIAAAAALGAVIADGALTPRIDAVTLSRHGPARMAVGVQVPVRVVLSQLQRHHGPLPPVLLIDEHPSLPSSQLLTPALPRGGSAVLELRVTPLRRGHWPDAGTDVLEAHSPLGGFVRRRRISAGGPTWVHPPPAHPIPLPAAGQTGAAAMTASSRRGVDLELYGIREWRSGDTAGSVHWRASARRNRLVVTERERPNEPALVIVTGPAVPGPRWEGAVARAAATAVSALGRGRPVRLVDARRTTAPDRAVDVLDWSATLGDGSSTDVATVRRALTNAGRAASLLWLATDAVPPELTRLAQASGVQIVAADTVADGRLPA